MSDIFARAPINKTAAIVVGQSGCASDNTLSDEQLRENLVRKWKDLNNRIAFLPKKSELRAAIGQEMQQLQNKINTIRPAKKAKGVEQHFIDVARETLTKPQFDSIMGKAAKRLKE